MTKILAYFPHHTSQLRDDIGLNKEPRERMYGLLELADEHYQIDFADFRYEGLFSKINGYLRPKGFNLIHPKNIFNLGGYSAVVIKDEISFTTSLLAKILGVNVIYYDSLFFIPKNRIKKFLTKQALKWSSSIIHYSQDQAKEFSNAFNIDLSKFKEISFALDPVFYRPLKNNKPSLEKSIVSVGRDIGRDFETLAQATTSLGLKLHLVTLDYLLPCRKTHNFENYQFLSYESLFRLYAESDISVVPLKKGINYASGVRAILEALHLGKVVVTSKNSFTENSFKDNPNIAYYEPESPDSLINAINKAIKKPFEQKKNIKPEYHVEIRRVIDEVLRVTNER